MSPRIEAARSWSALHVDSDDESPSELHAANVAALPTITTTATALRTSFVMAATLRHRHTHRRGPTTTERVQAKKLPGA